MSTGVEVQLGGECWVELNAGGDAGVFSIEPGAAPIESARAEGCDALLWGMLYDREDLRSWTGAAAEDGDAQLALRAYLRLGESCFSILRGVFALVIWDSRHRSALAARDHLGVHPLFYARTGHRFVVSPCINAVLRHHRVSRELNRPALADHIMHRWPVPEETFFAALQRVPPASFLRISPAGHVIQRYWDPLPPGQAIDWIRQDELPRFDHLLLKAVRRTLSVGAPAIFLSGGLDSVSIAAMAAGQRAGVGAPPPLALSLDFPVDSEESVQRAVAAELGLEQVLLHFNQAVGPDGWFTAALKVSRSWPAPLLNGWMPAYLALGANARRLGRASILTGVGGDEWLGVSPTLAADYLRHLNLRGWWRLFLSDRRSLRISLIRSLRNVTWDYGLRPIVADVLRAAPGGRRLLKSRSVLRTRFKPPVLPWVAPDPALRAELSRRQEEATNNAEAIRQAYPSHYFRHCRAYSEHLLPSWENEEYHVQAARLGVRILHPFLDPDLIEFLYRVPPELLNKGGRSKGLLREALDRQFPRLGFQRQRKSYAVHFGANMLLRQGPQAMAYTSGTPALARLGILDRARAESALQGIIARGTAKEVHRIWLILNLESWAAGHMGSGGKTLY